MRRQNNSGYWSERKRRQVAQIPSMSGLTTARPPKCRQWSQNKDWKIIQKLELTVKLAHSYSSYTYLFAICFSFSGLLPRDFCLEFSAQSNLQGKRRFSFLHICGVVYHSDRGCAYRRCQEATRSQSLVTHIMKPLPAHIGPTHILSFIHVTYHVVQYGTGTNSIGG